MWGICLNNRLPEGTLFQRAVEYRRLDENTVMIIQPVQDQKIDIQDVRPIDKPPLYGYGDAVSVIDHPDRKGVIRDIIWHFERNVFVYYLEMDGKKNKTRYTEEELVAETVS